MFEGYHGSGGFENSYLQPLPSRMDQSLDAARNSLARAYELYRGYRQITPSTEQDILKNRILTEVTFARSFYLKVQRDIHDHPLETAGYGPWVTDLEHRIDGLIDALRANGIVYEDMLQDSPVTDDRNSKFSY